MMRSAIEVSVLWSACFWFLGSVDAFSVTHQQTSQLSSSSSSPHHHQLNLFRRQLCANIICWAKPPPVEAFDLESIEAFEAELDKKAAGLDLGMENPGDEDDDSDDETCSAAAEEIRTYEITAELKNKRIDAALSALEPSLSRSICGTLVSDGKVQVLEGDNTFLTIDRKSYKVVAGSTLRVAIPTNEKPVEIIPEDIPLNILYEDEHMIVLNKAAGMVVHPAAGNWDGTIVNALAFYLQKSPHGSGDFIRNENSPTDLSSTTEDGESVSFRPGIVHRLDKGTTGVLVVAKTTNALAALSEAFASRTVKKTYLAITVGNPGKRVTIDKPTGRHPVHRQRMRVVPDPHRIDSSGMAPKDRISFAPTSLSQQGRRALSHVDTIAFDGKLSLVQVRIETGRTHQIRVHLQDRRTPIYGDEVYGIADWNKRLLKSHGIERPLLHAYRLEIDHPVTGEHMTFVAPMADDMMEIATKIYPQGEEERPELFHSHSEDSQSSLA